ncbi:ABC transporter permease [Kitasatospora xanthocidica]|uniref:FtsX-like permease family protein n=1 Tax=Kitasatospora xanthocidica TaxID=83382 RepID=UPI0019BDF0A8|nr:FtsX-like permease family protein [Kitasatospora xanthocidica]GHF78148.1 ABC transporter permease [Kitasatospora xanthocidica]
MMLSLALATLRHRAAGFAGAFVALFCAAALVCGCGTLLVTGLTGTVRPERYAAAPIVVSGDQDVHAVEDKGKGKVKEKSKPVADHAWVPAALADRIAALPSVRAVATEVTFPVLLPGGPTGGSWGHGWESAPLSGLTLAAGRAPSGPDEVVVDAATAAGLRLSPGSTTTARTASGTLTVHVVGVTAQGFDSQAAVYFAPDRARRLAGHDGLVGAIGVFPAAPSAADDVRALLAGTRTVPAPGGTAPAPGQSVPAPVVRTGDDRGRVEFPDAANAQVRLVSMGAVLAGTSLLVALLVVVGTFGLSIQQRQREIAVLRAVAATGRQVRKMIGGEALAIGLAAGTLGAAAGLPLGDWLHGRFVALDVIPANLPVVLSPFPVVAAAAATLLAGWAAARLSARRATAVKPVEALGEAELKPPRLARTRIALGVLATAGAVTLTALLTVLHSDQASTPACFVAVLLWCTALALLGPLVARAGVAVLGLPLRASRVGGYLAAHNLRAGAHRLASVVTPLTLLVAMACTILFTQTTVDHAADAQRERGNTADFVVGPRVPGTAAQALAAVPGVRTVTRVLHTQVRDGLTKRSVQAVTPERLSDTLDLGVTAGDLGRLTDGTAAAADGLGYRLGQRVRLVLADGTPAEVTVVALYGRGLGFGDLTLAHSLVTAHVDVPLDDELLVRGDGSGAAPTRQALTAALHGDPGLGVLERAAAVQASQTRVSAQIGYVTLGLIIAFVAIAVLNTLAMSISDRRPEFAALRLTGATRRQIRRMLGWETAASVAVATALGLAIAVAVLTTYAQGITRGTAGPAVPATTLALVLAGTAALAALGTWLPARTTLRGLRGRA